MKSPSRIPLSILLITIAILVTLVLAPGWNTMMIASAQVPAAETTVTEVATVTSSPTPTNTPANTPGGPTSTPTTTSVTPANTPTQVVTLPPDAPTPPPSGPVPIPEPVTVVLFGTGLAALSAALASRRKTEE